MLTRTLPLYLQDASEPHAHPQARVCGRCEVRSNALFGALDEDGLQRIHALIDAPQVSSEAPIFGRNDPAVAVYTIREGIVRFERLTEGGERRIVRLAGPGDLIGLEALVQRPYADEAVACTPVQLCRIPSHLVAELGQSQAALPTELMRRWQLALEQSEAWVTDLATGAARRRMLKLLSRLAQLGLGRPRDHDSAPEQRLVWLPQRNQIGDMLDLTLETASRIISQLRRDGVLSVQPPRHALLDMRMLARELQAEDNR
jgi:CRP/FNR family transcriptional regulator, anaerobic regulatory protein